MILANLYYSLYALIAVLVVDVEAFSIPRRALDSFPKWGQAGAALTTTPSRLSARSTSDDEPPPEEVSAATPEKSEETKAKSNDNKKIQPEILSPFPPAADPDWMNRGPVGQGAFVVSRQGGPTDAELANENILKIVRSECTDLEVNTLVWKCLGYRFQQQQDGGNGGTWTAAECFPKWKEKYPAPPDLIGMQRVYAPEIDKPSLRANQALVKSIPAGNKQSLKAQLKPLGWKGYQYAELTPNKTRRAQCANWLVFYREELFGYTVEELRERRQQRLREEAERKARGEWQPPVREVF